MKVIYIAGPYRNKSEFQVYRNIDNAGEYALQVWYLGGAAICPHKNTAFFGGALGIKDDTWLEGDLEIISRCDAIYAMPEWNQSAGAYVEIEFANNNGIPVLYTYGELKDFLEK